MCGCDNPPELYRQKTVRGRKVHQCCECLADIPAGQPHEYIAGSKTTIESKT